MVVLAVYYYLYTRVSSNKDTKKIWVPPKPKPTLPFGLGPAPEPIKIEDFEETTYKDYEIKLLKEGVQAVVMSGGISFLMSMKFSPMPLLIQSVMIPITMSENLVMRKYIMGVTKNAEGKNLYNEEFTAPTAATVAALNAAIAAANATGTFCLQCVFIKLYMFVLAFCLTGRSELVDLRQAYINLAASEYCRYRACRRGGATPCGGAARRAQEGRQGQEEVPRRREGDQRGQEEHLRQRNRLSLRLVDG